MNQALSKPGRLDDESPNPLSAFPSLASRRDSPWTTQGPEEIEPEEIGLNLYRLLKKDCTCFDKLSMNGFSSTISMRAVRPELRRRVNGMFFNAGFYFANVQNDWWKILNNNK